MHERTKETLSDEAKELVARLNGLAVQIMCDRYEGLTLGMRIKLSRVIGDTQRMLEDEAPSG